MQRNSQVHRPADCALAVSFPLSYMEFRGDYRHPHGRRWFPRHYGDQACGPGASPWRVWRLFAPVAGQMRAVCRHASGLGVNVCTAATLDDLRCLFESHAVVTWFSHCPFPDLAPGDICNPRQLAAELEADVQRMPLTHVECFRHQAGKEWQGYLSRRSLRPTALDDIGLQESLASCFNALIARDSDVVFNASPEIDKRRADSPASTVASDGPPGGTVLVRFSRLDFEIAFWPNIRACVTVDFADGARAFPALERLLPSGFSGVADLSICHSVVLGEFLKGTGKNRRPCVVVVNRPGTHIAARAWIYRQTIEVLGADGAHLDYVTANCIVREKLLSH